MDNQLQEHLTRFRVNYPLTKCIQNDNDLIYVLPTFYNASKSAVEANILIEKLNLPLVAIHRGSCSFFTVVAQDVPEN